MNNCLIVILAVIGHIEPKVFNDIKLGPPGNPFPEESFPTVPPAIPLTPAPNVTQVTKATIMVGRKGKNYISTTYAPMALKHRTGAALCKGGMVLKGAPVDPECLSVVKPQLEEFAGLKFESARCEKGVCILEYRHRNRLAYSCDVQEMFNGTLIGKCKILAPTGCNFDLPKRAKDAVFKTFIKEEMYY